MFKRTIQLLLVICLGAAALRAANDPFVGEWKLNPSRSKLTDEMKVESAGANRYAFDFGGGKETIMVDGTDQPGIFGTTLSVTVEGPDSWKVIRKKDGRMLVTASWELSKDGNTLTDNYTGFEPNGSTSRLHYVYKRTTPGSGFAGTWVSTSETVNSAYVLQVRPYEGDGLSFVDTSRGETKNFKFDGQDYPNLGPNAAPGSASSIRRVNERALEITDKINGRIMDTRELEISSDLKTLTITVHIVGRSEPSIRVFDRQ
jgi:hypothetical protein